MGVGLVAALAGLRWARTRGDTAAGTTGVAGPVGAWTIFREALVLGATGFGGGLAVLSQIEQRLASRTKQAVHGALARSQRSRKPRLSDIDWGHTIHANLRHYLPEQRTVVPERLIGYGRRQRSLSRDVIVAIDGAKVANTMDLNIILNRKRPGDTVTLTVYRGGKKLDIPVKLGERNENVR